MPRMTEQQWTRAHLGADITMFEPLQIHLGIAELEGVLKSVQHLMSSELVKRVD